jgi:hypothetical protein
MSKDIKDYFSIKELVDREVFNRFGDTAWRFLDPLTLECLFIIRHNLKKSITVNNWAFGGDLEQRGLRHNNQPIVKAKKKAYLSAHCFGKAYDFNVSGMDSTEVREWIVDNADLFPCQIRLERNFRGEPISWVHLDTIQDETKPKVYLFDV